MRRRLNPSPSRPDHALRARRREKRDSPVGRRGETESLHVPVASLPSTLDGVGGGDGGSSAQGGARVGGASHGVRGEVVGTDSERVIADVELLTVLTVKVVTRAPGKNGQVAEWPSASSTRVSTTNSLAVQSESCSARWRCDVDGTTASWYVRVPTQAESRPCVDLRRAPSEKVEVRGAHLLPCAEARRFTPMIKEEKA